MTDTASSFSFSRARRLDGPHAYAAVFAFKCWVTGEMFRVYARPNSIATPRLGVVTAKRVCRRAVDRNYCRRLAREVFRVERNALGDLDFVVRPLAPVTPMMAASARAELRGLLYSAQTACRRRIEAMRQQCADS